MRVLRRREAALRRRGRRRRPRRRARRRAADGRSLRARLRRNLAPRQIGSDPIQQLVSDAESSQQSGLTPLFWRSMRATPASSGACTTGAAGSRRARSPRPNAAKLHEALARRPRARARDRVQCRGRRRCARRSSAACERRGIAARVHPLARRAQLGVTNGYRDPGAARHRSLGRADRGAPARRRAQAGRERRHRAHHRRAHRRWPLPGRRDRAGPGADAPLARPRHRGRCALTEGASPTSRRARPTRSRPGAIQACAGAIERMRDAMAARGAPPARDRSLGRRGARDRRRTFPSPHAIHENLVLDGLVAHRPLRLTVSRLLFFLLLLAILALRRAPLALRPHARRPTSRARERNRDEVRIVAVTPPTRGRAQRRGDAQDACRASRARACVEFSGIAGSDAPRARDAFDALQLGDAPDRAPRRGDHALLGLHPRRPRPPRGRDAHGAAAQPGRERHVDPPRQRDLARRLLHRGGRAPLPHLRSRPRA